MSRLFKLMFLLYSMYLPAIDSARILGVYPVPSVSHQVVFRSVTLELLKRGHEIVVITTDPIFKNTDSPVNLTEIDTSECYKVLQSMLMKKDVKQYTKRGVIMSSDAFLTSSKGDARDGFEDFIYSMFNVTAVKQLIEDKNQKFDLIIVESFSYGSMIFSKLFEAPVVLFSSFYGTATNYEAIGAIARHPLIYPYMFRSKYRNLSIMEKIEQLKVEYQLWKFDQDNEKSDNAFLKSQFGSDAPTIAELKKNVVMLLVNSHPIFDGNRPVPPATIYLGALHLQPVKDLPQDLKSYLDNSSRGVVYVSLGTNVRPSAMDKDFLDAFLDAFENIPYDILWKFDDDLDRVPKNVKIQKWFPQRDLLGHPNIKLFVTQGGLQSTDEAIDAEVPLVGIPMLGDQWYNVNKYVELGIGVEVDSYTMVADDLVKAVNTVANDPSYKENIKKIKAIMQDQPEKPIDRAVWWIEHVLRHKGSRHLLGAAAQMSWSEYLMLDVIITLAVVCSILVTVAAVTIYVIVGLVVKKKSSIKVKQH